MLNLVLILVASACLFTPLSKGRDMENRIDKIDVQKDHQELIALFYRIQLRNFIQILLYEHGIK